MLLLHPCFSSSLAQLLKLLSRPPEQTWILRRTVSLPHAKASCVHPRGCLGENSGAQHPSKSHLDSPSISALERNCLHLHTQPLVPWGSSFQVRVKTHQQGCVKEATALIRGVLRVSGACQVQQAVTGTLRQRARQTGLGGKILASRGYRCSLARCQQKIPAGWFLPAEGNLGRRKAKPPPFSMLYPIPAPASPTARSQRSQAPQRRPEFLPQNTAGTQPRTAQPKHKGEDKPKINTHAHKRTHTRMHTHSATMFGGGGGGRRRGKRWREGGWVVRKNFMLASLKVCYLFKAVQTFAERWQARNVCKSSGSVS